MRPEGCERERPTRVLVVDGDPLARRVIRAALATEDGFAVVGECEDGAQAVVAIRTTPADFVVLELRALGEAGVGAIEELMRARPQPKVVAFSQVQADSELALQALRAGACSFVPKDGGIDAMVQALAAAARGETMIPRTLVLRIIERLRCCPDGGIGTRPVRSTLTTREWEVLDVMTRGASTREMAESMFLSEYTVYSHVKNIMRKLDVHSRSEALDAAVRQARPR